MENIALGIAVGVMTGMSVISLLDWLSFRQLMKKVKEALDEESRYE